MQTLTNEQVHYAMSGENKPFIHVESGELFCVRTKDCYSDKLQSAQDKFTKEMWDTVNPATGPVYVNGAKAGDILRVDIEQISTRDWAVMCVENGSGALASHIDGIETTILPIKNGLLIIDEHLSVPVKPMIGVIGTAPAGECILNGTPGEHGGNMDCKEIVSGTSLYLPVSVEGGLLALGDIHAVMGDGEVCICGAEVAGEVLRRARRICAELPTPCLEPDESIIFIASALTLDECERKVLDKAHTFLIDTLNLSANEAARVMSLIGELGICQVVDPLKTMKFMIPKTVLEAYSQVVSLTELFGAPG